MPDSQAGYLDRPALARLQREKLQALLAEILPRNQFYAQKFRAAGIAPDVDAFERWPFTTKAELLADQEARPPYGQVVTYPRERYSRLHQTSGTSGRPLRWLDTPDSWRWLLDCWEQIFTIAGLGNDERVFFPFSFGPFLGFWTAFDAASRRGYLCLPGGGMSSGARLRFMLENGATVVLCTPTYALRLAEAARDEGIGLAASAVRTLIVAGEPGGSIPATRARLESEWDARVIDHSGLTEVGALGIECQHNPAGLHLLESDYIAEVIDPAASIPVPAGQVGELVLTNLGRWGSPLLRYRTGDLVRVDTKPCPCGRTYLRLAGGILGRTDDMIHLRGINVFPSALEAVIRQFSEVAEYRVEVDRTETLAALRVEVEPASGGREPPVIAQDLAERVRRAIRDELLFGAEVTAVAPGTLPRFEMKSGRIVRRTNHKNH
jgi:phenylacetate-CoA ligase